VTIPMEQRQQAKELYIIEGFNLDQIAAQIGISARTVKTWSVDENWPQKRKEYQKERDVFQVSLAELKTKMLQKALESLDPQMAYAVVAIEKVLNMKKGAGQPQEKDDLNTMSKDELMKFLKDKIYGL
jgi:uncharacterized protein YjcR